MFHCFTLFANFPGGGRCLLFFCVFVCLGVGFVCFGWCLFASMGNSAVIQFDLPQFQLLTDNALYSSGNAGKKNNCFHYPPLNFPEERWARE